jgi:type II secretory pathway pseudopilin PulG
MAVEKSKAGFADATSDVADTACPAADTEGLGAKLNALLDGTGCCEQGGSMLLEVLVATIVIAISILGLSLMLVRSSAFTASQGTNQAELYLAEQKLERLRVLGFTGTPVFGSGDAGATAGCGTDTEPCYNETLQGGVVTNAQPQRVTRLTCVDYVSDGGPPYPANCPSAPPAQPACWSDPGDVTCTKRVRVTVQPLNQTTVAGADPITLEMILVNPPQATR